MFICNLLSNSCHLCLGKIHSDQSRVENSKVREEIGDLTCFRAVKLRLGGDMIIVWSALWDGK